MTFSEFFKAHRMEHGTVRQFAKKNGFDAAYISRLENGITLPPKDQDKLAKIGVALGLKKGTDGWQEFLDLAAIAKCELPVDLHDNKRIASILPAFYRTLRKKELDEEEVQNILGLIKKSDKEG